MTFTLIAGGERYVVSVFRPEACTFIFVLSGLTNPNNCDPAKDSNDSKLTVSESGYVLTYIKRVRCAANQSQA